MSRMLTIVLSLLCLSLAPAAYAIDYPTYKGQSKQRISYSGGVYSTAEQAPYDGQQQPSASFNSTSPYQVDANMYRSVNTMAPDAEYTREYSVPVSALSVTGGVTTEGGGSESEDSGRPGVRRISGHPGGDGGYNPEDPNTDPDMPVGDTPWLLMGLLAGVYVVYRLHKAHNVI